MCADRERVRRIRGGEITPPAGCRLPRHGPAPA
nr:MAG TPA: hypothetical protein [Caudoviricetes sp.]